MKTNVAKKNRRSQKWSLMFIGSDGALKQVKGFKPLVTLGLFLMTASIMAASVFYVLYDQKIKENEFIKSDLNHLQKQIKAYESENELLRARLVVYDPENGKSLINDTSEPEATAPPSEDEAAGGDGEEESDSELNDMDFEEYQSDDMDESVETPPEPEEPEPAEVTREIIQTAHLVDAEEFTVSKGRSASELNIKMKIVNIGSERISGHVILVLKQSGAVENECMAFPSVTMVDGRPTGDETGKTFSISRFKTMFFRAKPVDHIEHVYAATVFVFTKAGELLLEKTFPVSVN